MRGILIDPISRTVTEVDHKNDYRDIYRLIEATDFNAVAINDPCNHCIYVDGESLLVDEPGPFFQWKGYHQPIAGKGLILRTDEGGDSQDATFTLEFVRHMVTWPDIEFVGFEQIPDGTTIETAFGKMIVIGSTPIFRAKVANDNANPKQSKGPETV